MMSDGADEEAGVEVRKTLCWPSPGCHCNCGLLVRVRDNRILSIKGNPEFPYNRGAVCAERLPHFRKWLDHPDQLMHPLKRQGERGENRWERISWDQALDEIAARLQTIKAGHGAESLSTIEGTYRSDFYAIRARFLNLFGNPANVGASGTACACNKVALSFALAGTNIPCILAPPIKHLNCLVLLGRDYTFSNPIRRRPMQKWRTLKPAASLIVVDPRQTEMAKMADMWLQIRPGTDTALLMAWINVIIARGFYDREFVEQWTYGFEQLKLRAAEYTPERVAEITWIPADQIIASAIAYAGNKPGCINSGLAPDQFGRNAVRVEQAKLCLHAITGNMRGEAPGLAPEGPGPIVNGVMAMRDSMMQMAELCFPEQRAKQLGSDRFKLMTWPAYERINALYEQTYGVPLSMSGHSFTAPEPVIWRSIIDGVPYPTKALITWGSNPLLNAANTRLVYRALKSPNLDLHVVLEHFMTPTAMLADYVLPAASKLERGTLSTMEDFTSVFVAAERAIQPLGERKSDYYFFRELAIRLGFGESFPWKTEEELYDYRLQPLGITFEEAATSKYVIASAEPWTYDKTNPRTGKLTGFATRSGKFELYSNLLEELGYDPLPYYEEPPESPASTPEIFAEYPLILINGGRFLPQFQSEHRQLGMGLREQHPDPLLQIHPETAAKLGLREGDWAKIETPRGAIVMKTQIDTGIDPRVVHAEHCWWFPEQPGAEPSLYGLWQSNVNVLTTDDLDACDQVTGSWPGRALLCRVSRAVSA
ncbi:MAG TPA: molybdopterin-dependent oxidoreductase [Acidobacteriota bacterium]|nr:molybdopterin-dependent oxidoreductase [Acidobacteriota bacterium]